MTDLGRLRDQVNALVELCAAADLKIATAESCTGGIIAAAITAVPGASHVFDWGVVTYANAAKTNLLGVRPEFLAKHGAVSAEIAMAMAEAALARSGANITVAVTGIAGPGGGTLEKPIGLVYIATAASDGAKRHARHLFPEINRDVIRLAAAEQAILMLSEAASAFR